MKDIKELKAENICRLVVKVTYAVPAQVADWGNILMREKRLKYE